MPEQGRDLPLQLEAADDAVDHAVREQELGALKAGRELLPNRLLDDARTGEADERALLGEVHLPEEREARRDAARGWVEEHAEVGKPRVPVALERRDGLGHLHQAEDAFLHARPSAGAEQYDGKTFRRSALEEARDLLADHGAHRPAHEGEQEGAPRHGTPLDACASDLHAFAGTRRLLRGADSLGVGLAVDELERVGGCEVRVPLLERALVEQQLTPPGGGELVVVAALRADFEVGGEGVGRERLAAPVALAEDALAEGLLLRGVALGRLLLGPGHDSPARGVPQDRER